MYKTCLKWSVCAVAVVALSGCAGVGRGPSNEEMIMSIMTDMYVKFELLDFEAATAGFSDDFEMSDGLDKAGYLGSLNGLKEAGALADLKMTMDDMVITIDGDTAEASPLVATGAFGTATIEMELEKRDGTWIVVYLTQTLS